MSNNEPTFERLKELREKAVQGEWRASMWITQHGTLPTVACEGITIVKSHLCPAADIEGWNHAANTEFIAYSANHCIELIEKERDFFRQYSLDAGDAYSKLSQHSEALYNMLMRAWPVIKWMKTLGEDSAGYEVVRQLEPAMEKLLAAHEESRKK